MDKIQSSGKIEKTQAEVQKAIGAPVALVLDLNCFSQMPPEDAARAMEWVSGDGYYNTFRLAFNSLCKVPSGKAWLGQFQKIQVGCFSQPQQPIDVVCQINAQAPMMTISVALKTSKNLRMSYSQKALEQALTLAVPGLKVGQDVDKITKSGKLEKTQEEVQKALGSPQLQIEFNLFSITNMPLEEGHNAAEWVSGDGYYNTFRLAFNSLCKVGSGKAWLGQFSMIQVNAVSNPMQSTDVVCEVAAQVPLMQIEFSLKTSKNLRMAYSQKVLEDAITLAVPQLKTGQDIDKITSSKKLEKTQEEVQKALGSPQLQIEWDLVSITNMPPDECHHATEWVSGDGYYNTFRLAFNALCKVGSGKAWLGQFTNIKVSALSVPQQASDVVCNVTAQVPLMTIQCCLKTSKNLRMAYSQKVLEDAITLAVPQLKTGQDIDKITSSKKLEKTQEEVQKALGAPQLQIEFNLFSITNMPPDECHHATEWVSGEGYYNTFRLAFNSMAKKPAFAQFMGQFPKIVVSAMSAPQQSADVVCQVVGQPGVLNVTCALKTSKSLRMSYSQKVLEDALKAASGVQ